MSTLTGNQVANTYKSLIKIGDNTTVDNTLKPLSDGLGNQTALSLSTDRVLISGSLILADGAVADLTASYAITASYVIGASSVIGVSGSTIYSIQPETTNFNTVDSVLIGDGAGTNTPDANNSVFIGAFAGDGATASSNAVFIGTQAGQDATDSTVAVFIGTQAGLGASDADYSVFIGPSAGTAALTAKQAVMIGNTAGQGAVNASYSTLIGYQAGALGAGATGIGSNNIIIGTNITLPDDTVNAVNIGGILFATGAYSDPNTAPLVGTVNGMVGINQPNPQYSLDVSGSGNFSGGVVGGFLRNQTVLGYYNTIPSHGSILNPTNLTIQGTDIFITEENADYYALGDVTNNGTLIVSGTLAIGGALLGSGPVFISPSGSII